MKTDRNHEGQGILLLLLTGTLWGTASVYVNGMKALGAGPDVVVLLRLPPAFLFILVLALVKYGPAALKVDRRTLFACFLAGMVSQVLFNLCYVSAIQIDGSAMAAVLLYLAPSMTMVESALLFKERVTLRKAAAVLLNLAGCALAVTGGDLTGINVPLAGILLGIGAGLCFSLNPVFGRFAMDGCEPMVANVWIFFFASAGTLLFVGPGADFSAVAFTGPFWLYAAGNVVLVTVLPYLLYYEGINRLTETAKVPVITSMEPVVATLVGAFWFHEGVTAVKWLGVALVIGSIVLMNLGSAAANDAAPPAQANE